MRIRRNIRSICSCSRGQAAVESALALMLTLVMVIGSLEVARLIWTQATVYYAARVGARYAIVRSDESNLSTKIATTVKNNAIGLTGRDIQVTSNWTPTVARGSTYKITVSYNFKPIGGPIWGGGGLTIPVKSSAEYTVLN